MTARRRMRSTGLKASRSMSCRWTRRVRRRMSNYSVIAGRKAACFRPWPPTTSPPLASFGGRMATHWSATSMDTFISSADKIDREQILCRGDEQPPSVGASEGAVRRTRGRGHEAQLAPIRRPYMHAVRRTRPHPAARIDCEAVRIAMVGVTEEAAVGERAAIAHVERDDLVRSSGFMSGHLAERQ